MSVPNCTSLPGKFPRNNSFTLDLFLGVAGKLRSKINSGNLKKKQKTNQASPSFLIYMYFTFIQKFKSGIYGVLYVL